MKFSKRLVLILAPLVLYAVAAIVWVCVSLAGSSTGTGSGGGGGGIVEGDYEFVFSGSVETNTGRTFTLALTGNKDEEQTLDLTVQEMPALSIDGNWTFTENKGYKIFLNDANGTFAYSRYDTDTQTFSVTFDYDMGNFGRPRAVLTYKDEAFAEVYDGVGLGLKPPTFSLEGYTTFNHYSYGTLSFKEDGTVTANLTNTGAGWYFNREGFWEFNEETQEYDFWFTDSTISLTDGNLNIRGEEGAQYVYWSKYTKDSEEPEFRIELPYDEFVNDYHLFTGEEYMYHTEFIGSEDRYYVEIEAQYNWGLATGDIITFSGYASLADMEG